MFHGCLLQLLRNVRMVHEFGRVNIEHAKDGEAQGVGVDLEPVDAKIVGIPFDLSEDVLRKVAQLLKGQLDGVEIVRKGIDGENLYGAVLLDKDVGGAQILVEVACLVNEKKGFRKYPHNVPNFQVGEILASLLPLADFPSFRKAYTSRDHNRYIRKRSALLIENYRNWPLTKIRCQSNKLCSR